MNSSWQARQVKCANPWGDGKHLLKKSIFTARDVPLSAKLDFKYQTQKALNSVKCVIAGSLQRNEACTEKRLNP